MFSCWIELSAKPMPHSVVLPEVQFFLFFIEKNIYDQWKWVLSFARRKRFWKKWIGVNIISFNIQSCWQMLQIGQVMTVVSWDCPPISGALKNAFYLTSSPKPFWNPISIFYSCLFSTRQRMSKNWYLFSNEENTSRMFLKEDDINTEYEDLSCFAPQ